MRGCRFAGHLVQPALLPGLTILLRFAFAESLLQQAAPPLQTAVVPQSCTPSWHAEHAYRQCWSRTVVGALATQV